MKKEQQKKGKKGAGDKKEEKSSVVGDGKAEDMSTEEPLASTTGEDVGDDAKTGGQDDAEKTEHPSSPHQSKQRSESFRQGNSGPLSPGLEVQELYKKQASRIEELELENKILKEQRQDGDARLAKAEDELESLRERSSDMAELRSKAKEADRLTSELAAVQRQLAQTQQAVKSSQRRVSGTNPDVTEQLASKTSTIESLELELSNLRHQFHTIQNTLVERDNLIKDIEEKVKTAESATESYKQELDQLKVSMTFPSEDAKAAQEDPEALTKRITVLESDLRTANSTLDAAQKRASSLEQKIEALTKLHRDTVNANLTKDKELVELRNQMRRQSRPSHVRDASEFELGEDETETGALQARIRALEAENFDLRRGVWREKRGRLQPGMDDYDVGGHAPEYEDVDLNGPYNPHGRNGVPRQSSTFQDVINSGISVFMGQPRDPHHAKGQTMSPKTHARKQSLGLLSDDGGLDEEAFRLAQEEEAKRRIERVKEVKRGLEAWKGWRVDLMEQRQSGASGTRMDVGPVFEV